MAASVTIGSTFDPNLAGFSIDEQSTPTEPSDSSGGVGALSVSLALRPDSYAWVGKDAILKQDNVELIRGQITGVSDDDANVTITSLSLLGKLNTIRDVQPFTGTLKNAMIYYCSLVGIASGALVVDASIAGRTVAVQGWRENMWVMLKEFVSVQRIEIATRGAQIFIRPLRGRMVSSFWDSSRGGQSDNSSLAQFIEIYNYNSISRVNTIVYPPGKYTEETGSTTAAGWTSEAPLIQVDAFERAEFDVEINASLTSVQQPVAKKIVGPNDSSASVYTVMGKDGVETLDPAVWTARGGKVTVTINPDTTSLHVVVDPGSNDPVLAPFRLGMSSGNTDYSTLRIVGTGVFNSREKLRIATGVPASVTNNEVGATIDSVFITTLEQVYQVASAAMQGYGAPYRIMTGGSTNTGQAIGDTAGARLRRGDSFYRIRNATTSELGVSFGADQDTLFSDFKSVWAGKTFAQFKAARLGITGRDFAAAPLKGS